MPHSQKQYERSVTGMETNMILEKAKRLAVILCIACLCTVLSGCNKNKDTDNKGTGNINVTTSPALEAELGLSELITISIYSVDSTGEGLVESTAFIPVIDYSPSKIVSEVVTAMEDSAVYIGIDEVTEDGDVITISFVKDSAPVSNTQAEQELLILDAIAQSLLDNMVEYDKIVFRTEGEAYNSANRKYSKDYVYMERK